MTRAFETAVAARISRDAMRERYCWEPWCDITDGTRKLVMPTRRREPQKRATKASLRLRGMVASRIMGTGKAMRRRSVITSQVPIVMRFT